MASNPTAPRRRAQHTAGYRVICDLLRQWREERGLSQRELADILGTGQTTVARCEAGDRRIDPVELVAWCRATGIEPTEGLAEIERLAKGREHPWNLKGDKRTKPSPAKPQSVRRDRRGKT